MEAVISNMLCQHRYRRQLIITVLTPFIRQASCRTSLSPPAIVRCHHTLQQPSASSTSTIPANNHPPFTTGNQYRLRHSVQQPLPSLTANVETHDSIDMHHNNAERLPEAFQFVAYAAWHPKNRLSKQQRQAESRIPYWKHRKVGKVDAGEDAFFNTCTSYGLALGVADGVGGWADVGVDPALFSWTLMNNAAMVAKKQPSIDACQILDTAFHQLRYSGKVKAGSSTACILSLCKRTGKMTTCNLGDSAFYLIRDSKIIYKSPSQQHYFNCPYQLTVVPEQYPDYDGFVTDLPKQGNQKSFHVKENDIIVLATDGYFDNVYPHETLALVNASVASFVDKDEDGVATGVRLLAKTLSDTARRLSLDPKRLSPWAKDAQMHGSNYYGGKIDDITCIVTFVRGVDK